VNHKSFQPLRMERVWFNHAVAAETTTRSYQAILQPDLQSWGYLSIAKQQMLNDNCRLVAVSEDRCDCCWTVPDQVAPG